MSVVQRIAQAVRIDIYAKHGHSIAREIVDGHSIADEPHFQVDIVVRSNPTVGFPLHNVFVEAVLRVIKPVRRCLQSDYVSIRSQGIGFEQPV